MAYDHRVAGFPADELVVALPERAEVRERSTTQRQILWRSGGGPPQSGPRAACTWPGDTW